MHLKNSRKWLFFKLLATSIAVISEFFSVDDINDMPLEELADFIAVKGRNRFDEPERIAKELKAAARSSYRLSKTVNNSVNLYPKGTRYRYKQYNQNVNNVERPNLLNQMFFAKSKNRIWVGDITNAI